jgi:hypothetical protein
MLVVCNFTPTPHRGLRLGVPARRHLGRTAEHRLRPLRRQQRRHAAGPCAADGVACDGRHSPSSSTCRRWRRCSSNGPPERRSPRPRAAGRCLQPGRPWPLGARCGRRRQLRRGRRRMPARSSCACSTPTAGTNAAPGAARPQRRRLARLPAGRRRRAGLRPARPRPLAARPRPPLQPAQAAARPLGARDRRPVRLGPATPGRPTRTTRCTGTARQRRHGAEGACRRRRVDWGGDRPAHAAGDSVLYECTCARASPRCTRRARGAARHLPGPGLDAGDRPPAALGITAVSLLPVHQHLDEQRLVQLGLVNHWGYNTLGFFCPETRAMPRSPTADRARRVPHHGAALHAAGIEVLLDVVYNHTAEGDELGPTLSWRGLDNASWYRLPPTTAAPTTTGAAAATPERAPPARAAVGAGQPALLGAGDARRRLPLRPGHRCWAAATTASTARARSSRPCPGPGAGRRAS